MIGKLLKAHYELVGLLSDGPIFATYVARDRIQGRDISARVLKAPFSHESELVDRLVATVQKYSVIQSANIERLHSVESDKGVPFIIGDLTRGPSLAERIKKLAPFSIPVSVGTAISILHALDAIHRTGFVHGDLNPQFLAVMADGDIRLQMTGIWEAYSASPTAGAMVLPGMSPYLAPEVSAGSMPSASSDVYSVGVILFELISGRPPYSADTPLALALQHSQAPTPSVRSMNSSVPVVLDEIVKKAMSKDPRARYSNASEMLSDLKTLQDSLRFGRSLTWPLRPEPVQSSGGPTGRGPASKPQPVAPRMSAIRKAGDDGHQRSRQDQDRDVPKWMVAAFLVGVVIFASLCGTWLMTNLNHPRWVTVPNIKTLSVTEATSLLQESKLSLRISSHEASDTIDQDAILDVGPEPGQRIREGGQVSVVVSSGSRYVSVPDLKGLTLDKAKTILATLSLTLSDNSQNISDPTVPRDLIVKSDPPAKTKIERQSQIKAFVSSGPSEETTSSQPAPDGGYLFTLNLRLRNLTHRTLVKIEMADDDGSRSVYSQMHNSGDQFSVTVRGQYRTATFRIYYDGVLVMSRDKDAEGDEVSDEPLAPDTQTTGGER